MDWAKFIEDNAQSLFTLGGVIFGALLTFFGAFINNWFQAKERDKDRKEQRREAKIQAKEKWIEQDILELMDLLKTLVRLSSTFSLTADKGKFLIDSHESKDFEENENLSKQAEAYNKELERIHDELLLTSDYFNSVVTSFQEDEELMKVHKFLVDTMTLIYPYRNIFEITTKEVDAHFNVGRVSGLYRKALREKLISIRDIQT